MNVNQLFSLKNIFQFNWFQSICKFHMAFSWHRFGWDIDCITRSIDWHTNFPGVFRLRMLFHSTYCCRWHRRHRWCFIDWCQLNKSTLNKQRKDVFLIADWQPHCECTVLVVELIDRRHMRYVIGAHTIRAEYFTICIWNTNWMSSDVVWLDMAFVCVPVFSHSAAHRIASVQWEIRQFTWIFCVVSDDILDMRPPNPSHWNGSHAQTTIRSMLGFIFSRHFLASKRTPARFLRSRPRAALSNDINTLLSSEPNCLSHLKLCSNSIRLCASSSFVRSFVIWTSVTAHRFDSEALSNLSSFIKISRRFHCFAVAAIQTELNNTRQRRRLRELKRQMMTTNKLL